ncbi:MAG: DNA-processing protein DprA [Sphaerochaetaceae bacterium]|nr:DNA-processing protein DprA [Sphaerochaetaceae bacterium]MDC7237209.1 DNA-processing protein DprA [Sphaerochaetaceae bacterium]MDC7243843.1 DNA-processing protein DprA [Sphaerochaetaceae bacterium]MDC7250381.1 DNA-processing protein DprA [Sphaerochaetaceae bacterium]
MIKDNLVQAINWETLVIVCNSDFNKACFIWDKYKHLFSFPISSDFSLWASNLSVSINKLFEIYTKVCEDFKTLSNDTTILLYGDDNWPTRIDDSSFPTRILYCKGNLDLLNKQSVSIIGTKSPKKESVDKVDKVVKSLIKNEIIVISGLSFGIQGHAAVNSLSNFAPVIAVLATPLDKVYPKEHKKIQDYIEKEGGLVITRVAPNNKNIKWNILLRNRLMTSLSCASIIIEERDRGGAIQIAEHSLEINRNVFFFSYLKKDSSITWPKLLIEKGAKSIRFPSDLPKALNETEITKIAKKTNKEEVVQLKLF